MLLGVWDVSKSALVNEEFQGLIKLTYLTTAIQVSGVLFVGLLPEYKEDLERMKTMRGGSSKVGGAIFIFITFSSIAYAISVGLLNIIAPGWMGESWHRTANSHNNTARATVSRSIQFFIYMICISLYQWFCILCCFSKLGIQIYLGRKWLLEQRVLDMLSALL